ncbi:MAG TPA: glycosyltransferase family 2 protein [Tepidisphaeraceae bacterium]
MPRVTAIIPTFNWSSVLPFSIGSVLRQTFQDFELLVIGDGCTDDSEQVVNGIGDPRVRWMNLPANSGHQSEANNLGLRKARGDVIAYLGHDDLWLPHHLSVMVAAIDGGADMSYGITAMIAPDGSAPQAAPDRLGEYVPGLWIPPTGVVHRRLPALEAGGWPLFHQVDCDPELALWEQMHKRGNKVVFIARLTAVKFPGAWRKDVYKVRAVHEQAEWSKKIATQPDVEAIELGAMLVANGVSREPDTQGKPFTRALREFADDVSGRVRRRLFGPPPKPKPKTRLEVFNERRQFKGLDPKPMPGSESTFDAG